LNFEFGVQVGKAIEALRRAPGTAAGWLAAGYDCMTVRL